MKNFPLTRKAIVVCFASLLLLPSFFFSQQKNTGPGWITKNAFRQDAFVENKTQYDNNADPAYPRPIHYSVSNDGMEIYITNDGVFFKQNEKVKKDPSEFPGGQRQKGQPKFKREFHYTHLTFLGATAKPEIIASDPVSHYYTFGDNRDKTGRTSIKSNAFQKVTCKNIYPGIDVEYDVPDGKPGIKYSFILHPGADASLIKMKYTGEAALTQNASGNMVIKTSYGDLVDQAPLTFYEYADSHSIKSRFVLNNENVVSFELESYNKNNTVIIDPWISTPTFTGYNSGYEVDYDNNGNVYIYGGTYPWQEIKFNNAGAIQWVYTANPFNPSWGYYFGDFCVDHVGGSSYMVESINTGIGGEIIKVNQNGVQLIVFPGNVQLEELWRVCLRPCSDKLILGGGGVSLYNQAGIIDTNLTALTAVNVLGINEIAHDMCLLAVDNASNVFLASTNWGNVNYNNRLVKVPVATLLPMAWIVPDGYTFQEGGNLTYISGGASQSNGYNGIAVNQNFLYTCDGADLKKWDIGTGALVSQVNIAPTPRTCGGLQVDACDNIYVTVGNNVRRYDINLTLQQTIPINGVGFDIRLGPANKLYITGQSFVQELTLTQTCSSTALTLVTSSTGSPCTSNSGTATVTVTGGTGPYTYTWTPGGQTTQTATGLSSGTYTVTVSDASCPVNTSTATVVVTSSGSLTVTFTQTNVQCFNSTNGSATVTPTGGTAPYTYAWTPSGGTNATATGLSPGPYTVTITDASGCTATQVVTITAPPAITGTTTSGPTTCGASTGTASVTAGGGTGPYTYAWAPSGGNAANATGLGSGTYTVTITDANGCTLTATATVISSNGPTASLTAQTVPSCVGSSDGTATASATGGTGPYTYAWSPSGGNGVIGTGLAAGTYTVTVTDANGCTATTTVTIVNPTAITGTTTTIPTNCGANDGSATVTATGGTGPYTYAWTPSGGTGATGTGLGQGTFTVTITDANGCTQTATATIIVGNGPTAIATGNATITYGNSTPISASGGVTYLWNPTNGLSCTTCPNPTATPVVTTTYCAIVTDANGCTDSACITIIVDIPCPTNVEFTVPNAFSPNKDGKNDIFILQGMGLCLTEFLMVIYDRWGEKVFEVTTPNLGWDGTYKGKQLDPGVFVYYITATFTGTKEEFVKKGNISLIR